MKKKTKKPHKFNYKQLDLFTRLFFKPLLPYKNRFIVDVGRGRHPSLLLTELSEEIGVFHVSVSFPEVYLKDSK